MLAAHYTQANCSLVRECTSSAKKSVSTPEDWEHHDPGHDGVDDLTWMTTAGLWLLFSYSLFSIMGVTVTLIPFDALGQDFAKSEADRVRLFTAKGIANYVAGVVNVSMTLVLCSAFPTSLRHQVFAHASVTVILVAATFVCLLLFVREDVTRQSKVSRSSDNFGQVMLQVAHNRPFLEYLLSKVLLLVAMHLLFTLSLQYFKYVLLTENSVEGNGILLLCNTVVTPCYLVLISGMMKRVSARILYLIVALVFSTCHAAFSLLSIPVAKHYTYVLVPGYFAALTASTALLPNHLLAPTLDYHKLVHGGDGQAVFIMLDVNVVQMLDVIVGSLPAMILGMFGFKSNAGCSCGCGIACPPFHRWQCPDDFGSACTGALRVDNFPFDGEPTRTPPCLLQPAAVASAICLMFFNVPVLCALLAAMVLVNMSMTKRMAEDVKLQLDHRLNGKPCYDPILNVAIIHATGADSELSTSNVTSVLHPSCKRDVRRWAQKAKSGVTTQHAAHRASFAGIWHLQGYN